MRAVAYLRVSTDDQILDTQRGRIVAHCAGHDLDLDPSNIYGDDGLSGKRADNRPGLVAALDAVCAARGSVLVVYSLSRVARSVRDMLAIAQRLEDAGADLVSLTESIDTTTAAGKMVFRLLAVLAEFERDLISERTRARLNHKRTLNQRTGTLPLGKQLVDTGTRSKRGNIDGLADNPAELAIVARIVALHAFGLGGRTIARALRSEGVLSRKGKPLNESTIRGIIKRTTKS